MSRPAFSWGHITIYVSDLEASIAFYELLGFGIFLTAVPYLGIARSRDDSMSEALRGAYGFEANLPLRGCIMQLGGGFPKIDLICVAQDGAIRAPTDLGMGRLCLITADLRGEVARLRAAGVVFHSEPAEGTDGLADVAICADPDGTSIELLQLYPDRWAPYLPGQA